MFRDNCCSMQGINLNSVFSRRPNALAPVLGSDAYPDDFHSQPSGESGTKIACGVIKRNL